MKPGKNRSAKAKRDRRINCHTSRGARDKQDGDASGAAQSQTKDSVYAAGVELAAAVNGEWWVDGKLIVYMCGRDEQIKQQVLKSVMVWRYATQCDKPEAKWTKLEPCIDWHLRGQFLGRVHAQVFPAAFAGMKALLVIKDEPVKKKRKTHHAADRGDTAAVEEDEEPDQCYVEEVSWHQVCGRRAKTTIGLSKSEIAFQLMICLAIVLEGIRKLTFDLFAFMKYRSRKDGDVPYAPLSTLVWDASSPIAHVLQYYGQLLHGGGAPGGPPEAPRLRLLWQTFGYTSLSQFCIAEPALLRKFRNFAITASGWIYHRHWSALQKSPFWCALLGDPRVPKKLQESIASLIFSTRLCCLDWGVLRRLRENKLAGGASDLLTTPWSKFFTQWAWLVKLTIAFIEHKHGVHSQYMRSRKSVSWATFAAWSTNEHTHIASERDEADTTAHTDDTDAEDGDTLAGEDLHRETAIGQTTRSQLVCASAPSADAAPAQTTARGQDALHLFYRECVSREADINHARGHAATCWPHTCEPCHCCHVTHCIFSVLFTTAPVFFVFWKTGGMYNKRIAGQWGLRRC